jgi:hypothetical protein
VDHFLRRAFKFLAIVFQATASHGQSSETITSPIPCTSSTSLWKCKESRQNSDEATPPKVSNNFSQRSLFHSYLAALFCYYLIDLNLVRMAQLDLWSWYFYFCYHGLSYKEVAHTLINIFAISRYKHTGRGIGR